MTGEGLTQFRFEHFKAFQDRVEVDLAPITVIAGVNSGGKSTIFQSLLLARQTLLTPYRSTKEHALIYDGDLVRFADFQEMVFGKPEHDERGMGLGFTIQPSITGNQLQDILPFFSGLSQETISTINVQAKDLKFSIHTDFSFRYNKETQIVEVGHAVLSTSLMYEKSTSQGLSIFIDNQNTGKWFDESMFHQPMIVINRNDRRKIGFPRILNGFDRFIPILNYHLRWSDLGAILPQIERQHVTSKTNLSFFEVLFRRPLTLLRDELTRNLYYLGPLRNSPQRTYLRRNVTGLDIGTTGEYAVQQLYDHWQDEITFVDLPDDLAEYRPERIQPAKMVLGEAVQKILRLMGMEQVLKIERFGQSYEASLSLLSEPKTYVAITDVGFGVSQILPVIALGLLSPTNAILMLEQPEIHLHPRAQAGLADVLLCLSRTGRRVLIETHSEHIIDRLRRRVAEDQTNQLEHQVNILFVLPPTADQPSATVEKGSINRYGQIENWPPGFLAESAQDARAVMMASSRKRIQERANGHEQAEQSLS